MTFTSFFFIPFIIAVFFIFYFTKPAWRWLVLLLASYFFYATFGAYYLLGVLLGVTGITYAFAIWIEKSRSPRGKTILLISGILLDLVFLVGMRYLPFMAKGANLLAAAFRFEPVTAPPLLVSIGVSFYIFQGISYLVDVYLETNPAERHLGYFALYLSFFPKLLQGPIERFCDLMPQLRQPYSFDYDMARAGLVLFTWGLFLKTIVADRLAMLVNYYYNAVQNFQGVTLILATYGYALQIFFDFYGYTCMALGIARLFNIRLTNNFDHPYLARTVTDFWRRWHISFSSWLQDYVFRPLQLSLRRWRLVSSVVALIITFLVSGVWHGANRLFIIWGLLYALYMIADILFRPLQKKLNKKYGLDKSVFYLVLQTFLTFNLVSFAWIFFRANNLQDAWHVVRNLFVFTAPFQLPQKLIFDWVDGSLVVLGIIAYLVVAFNEKKVAFFKQPAIDRWSVYYLMLAVLVVGFMHSAIIGQLNFDSNFVYFKF